jgi:hypothetical protein
MKQADKRLLAKLVELAAPKYISAIKGDFDALKFQVFTMLPAPP